jgi:LysM repeat protein
MAYTVQSGDTLSTIAARYKTSVSELMKDNPSIKNANVISVGEKLNIPGTSDSFKPAAPTAPVAIHTPTTPTSKPVASTTTSASASGTNPASVAEGYLNDNISSLKASSSLKSDLDQWPANNVCCANFVSACLEKSGQISPSQHNDNVGGLATTLSNDPNFQKVSLANAKPGDVVCFSVPGEGSYAHTEIYTGMKNGQPQFIGSNNVNADGSQRITQGHVGYTIDAVFQYKA